MTGENIRYREQLPTSNFIRNRTALAESIQDSGVALFFAGRAPHKSADEQYPFFANRSFFYLTGIEQEESMLLMVRKGGQLRTTLFIRPRDTIAERWTGRRLSLEEASMRSGIEDVRTLESRQGSLNEALGADGAQLFMDQKADDLQAQEFRKLAAEQWPGIEIKDLSARLVRLRMVKHPEEIELIRQAAALTHEGIEAIMRAIRPGRFEYQVWGAFQRTLDEHGCLTPAFPSIVATGDNAFCLHYMTPYSQIQDGDLVLVDVGATVGGLNADISRVFPACGRFSERQKQIYRLVRACQETAFSSIQPGILIKEVNDACRETARKGLVALGILPEDGSAADYYWHGVSHHLGLDVHDLADREAPLEPGMVLTVEPGVYVPEWGVGIRIEDDVLVTAEGCVMLSPQIPREIDEIESLMSAWQTE